jgi:hypothetical protein
MSVTSIMAQLGAHLKNLRKIHVVREHARLASNANHNRRLLLSNQSTTAYSTTDDEEAAAYAKDVNHHDQVLAPAIESAYVAYRDSLQDPGSFFGVLAAELGLDADDLGDPIQYIYADTAGAIAITSRFGPLGKWYEEMRRERYVVVANKITAGSLEADEDNTGELALTQVGVDRFFPNCPTGVLTLVCTDPSISTPKFSVSLAIDKSAWLADGTKVLEAENELQAEQEFTDGTLGLNRIVLSRPSLAAPEESGDTAAIFSGWAISNPQDDDCDEGVFYVWIQRGATTWKIYVGNSSTKVPATVTGVKELTIATGVASNITITCVNGTVIEFDFDHDAADAEMGLEGEVYLTTTVAIGTFVEGDSWTLPLTNDGAGKISSKLMQAWRVALPFGPAKPSTAPTAALAGLGAGNLDQTTHSYRVSFVSLLGESGMGTASNVVTVVDNGADGQISLTGIPTGPAGTTARKIYRMKSGSDLWQLLDTISDNVTTSYTDNIAADDGVEGLEEVNDDFAASVQLD